ncbi:hypothetical protein AB0L70_06415 [Kribbella sp. NPDC051952]|uniref:hypothetical protein n=1 Tax=Kribbella sp. NPDC051952 TaxID=3154851 RepID=UPI00343BD913
MIQPEGIPVEAVFQMAGLIEQSLGPLDGLGPKFTQVGADVNGAFKQLNNCYQAPERDQLVHSTQRVEDNLGQFGPKLPQVAHVLSGLAGGLRDFAVQLRDLRARAYTLQAKKNGNPDWQNDQWVIDENNTLVGHVSMIMTGNAGGGDYKGFKRAGDAGSLPELALNAANAIAGLYGGRRWQANGLHEGETPPPPPPMTDEQRDQMVIDMLNGKKPPPPPWGSPEERDYPWYQDVGNFLGGALEGIAVAITETVGGLLTLVPVLPLIAEIPGVRDWADHTLGWKMPTFKDSADGWKGVAKLGATIVAAPVLLGWWGYDMVSGKDTRPDWVKDLGETGVATLKGFAAWDEWSENPGKAFGTVLTNVVTTVASGGVIGEAKGAAMAAKFGKAAPLVEKGISAVNALRTTRVAMHDGALGLVMKIPKVSSVVEGLSKIPIVGHTFKMEGVPKVDVPAVHGTGDGPVQPGIEVPTGHTSVPTTHTPTVDPVVTPTGPGDLTTPHAPVAHTDPGSPADPITTTPGSTHPNSPEPLVPPVTQIPSPHTPPPVTPVGRTEPGTTTPSGRTDPGTTVPSGRTDPGTTVPSGRTDPGTTVPSGRTDPGTTVPNGRTDPGTTVPSGRTDPGTAGRTDPGAQTPSGRTESGGSTARESHTEPAGRRPEHGTESGHEEGRPTSDGRTRPETTTETATQHPGRTTERRTESSTTERERTEPGRSTTDRPTEPEKTGQEPGRSQQPEDGPVQPSTPHVDEPPVPPVMPMQPMTPVHGGTHVPHTGDGPRRPAGETPPGDRPTGDRPAGERAPRRPIADRLDGKEPSIPERLNGEPPVLPRRQSIPDRLAGKEPSIRERLDGAEPHTRDGSSEPRPHEGHEPREGDPRAREPHEADPRAPQPHEGDPREPREGDPRTREPRDGEPREGDPRVRESHGEPRGERTPERPAARERGEEPGANQRGDGDRPDAPVPARERTPEGTTPSWHDPNYDPSRPAPHDPHTVDRTDSPEHEFGPTGSAPGHHSGSESPARTPDPKKPSDPAAGKQHDAAAGKQHDAGNDPQYDHPLRRQQEIDPLKPEHLQPAPNKPRHLVDSGHTDVPETDPAKFELQDAVGGHPLKSLFRWIHKLNPDNVFGRVYMTNCPDVTRALCEIFNGESPRLARGNKFATGEFADTTLEWMGLRDFPEASKFTRPPGRDGDFEIDQQAYQKVRDALQGRPVGTHANIGVSYVGGGGHRFAAVVDLDGKLKWIDGQPSARARELPEGSPEQLEAIQRDMVKDGDRVPLASNIQNLDFAVREPGGVWEGPARLPTDLPASQTRFLNESGAAHGSQVPFGPHGSHPEVPFGPHGSQSVPDAVGREPFGPSGPSHRAAGDGIRRPEWMQEDPTRPLGSPTPHPQPPHTHQPPHPQRPQNPYAQRPQQPHPQRPQDPYAQQPPHPQRPQDPYAQRPPQQPHPQRPQDPYAQRPRQPQEAFGPRGREGHGQPRHEWPDPDATQRIPRDAMPTGERPSAPDPTPSRSRSELASGHAEALRKFSHEIGDPDYRVAGHEHDFRDLPKISGHERTTFRRWREERPDARNVSDPEMRAIDRVSDGYRHTDVNEALARRDASELADMELEIRHAASGLNKLPDFHGAVKRGEYVDPGDLDNFLKRYEPGRTIPDRGFTTWNKTHEQAGNVQFHMTSKHGKDISFTNHHDKIVHPPGNHVRVERKWFDAETDTWHIELTDEGRVPGLRHVTVPDRAPQAVSNFLRRFDEAGGEVRILDPSVDGDLIRDLKEQARAIAQQERSRNPKVTRGRKYLEQVFDGDAPSGAERRIAVSMRDGRLLAAADFSFDKNNLYMRLLGTAHDVSGGRGAPGAGIAAAHAALRTARERGLPIDGFANDDAKALYRIVGARMEKHGGGAHLPAADVRWLVDEADHMRYAEPPHLNEPKAPEPARPEQPPASAPDNHQQPAPRPHQPNYNQPHYNEPRQPNYNQPQQPRYEQPGSFGPPGHRPPEGQPNYNQPQQPGYEQPGSFGPSGDRAPQGQPGYGQPQHPGDGRQPYQPESFGPTGQQPHAQPGRGHEQPESFGPTGHVDPEHRQPQAPPYGQSPQGPGPHAGQQPYQGQQPRPGQMPVQGRPPHAGQQRYEGQPPHPGQQPRQQAPHQQPYQGQPPHQQPYQGQPPHQQPYQGQPHQGQPYQGQPPHGQQPYQGQTYQGQPHQGQPHQGQPHQGQPQGQGWRAGDPAYGVSRRSGFDPAFHHRPLGDAFAAGVHDPDNVFIHGEPAVAARLADEGWRVDARPEDHTKEHLKNPEAMVRKDPSDEGAMTEFKTPSTSAKNLGNAIKRNINDASTQVEEAGEIVIDGRGVGLTEDVAATSYRRALGQPGARVAAKVHVILGDGRMVTFVKEN